MIRTPSQLRLFSATRASLALLLGTLLVLAAAPRARAADGSTGLGIIVGEPTGISLKQWVGSRNAFDGAAAWSFVDEEAFHLHVDYLWHYYDRIDGVEGGRVPLYIGIGGRVKFTDNDAHLGVRVPLGIDFELSDAPFDFFLEVVPLLDLAPDTDFTLNAAIGARFWLD